MGSHAQQNGHSDSPEVLIFSGVFQKV